MAKTPLVLYVIETAALVACGGPEVLEQFGLTEEDFAGVPGFARHEIHLVDPKQKHETEIQRAVLQRGEECRRAVTIEQYVERWTFAPPPNAEGFEQLPPNIAGEVYGRVLTRVFGGLAATDVFFEILNAKRARSSTPSDPTASPTSA